MWKILDKITSFALRIIKKIPPLKEDRTALTFEQNGKFFHFASIQIQRYKNELTYVFYFKDKKELVKFSNYEKSPPEETTARLPDHISFHRSGRVHLKYKNEKGKMNPSDKKELGTTPFSLGPDHWAPLMFHSIYEAQEKSLPTEVEGHNHLRELSIGSKTGRFTIVLFAIGEKVNEVNMLNTHFPEIFEKHVVLENIWLSPDSTEPYKSKLLIAISTRVPYPKQQGLFFMFGTVPSETVIKNIVN